MGDTYKLKLNCHNCGDENEDIYYHDDGDTFRCEFCGVENKIFLKFITE